jgi:hypothetical protein
VGGQDRGRVRVAPRGSTLQAAAEYQVT